MGLDGNGNYVLPPSDVPAISGQQIKSALFNHLMTDFATVLNAAFYRDGQAKATGDFDLNGHGVENLRNGANPQDAVTVAQVLTAAIMALRSVTPAPNGFVYFDTAISSKLLTIVPAVQALLTAADLPTLLASLGGQPVNALLTKYGAVAPVVDGIPFYTNADGTVNVFTCIAAIRNALSASSLSGFLTAVGAAASGINSDITSLTGLTTPLPTTEGGTGQSDKVAAQVDWGIPVSLIAGGTANAITATILTAPQTTLVDKMRVRVRAAAANTGAATLELTLGTVDTGAVPMCKGALMPLEAGDIAGAGHELELQYNATAGVWLLLNPATVTPATLAGQLAAASQTQRGLLRLATAAEAAALTAPDVALSPATIASTLSGAPDSGWVELPNGLISQWGRDRTKRSSETTVTGAFPITWPVGCLAFVPTIYHDSSDGSGQDCSVQGGNPTATTWSVYINYTGSGGNVSYGFDWFAIGR